MSNVWSTVHCICHVALSHDISWSQLSLSLWMRWVGCPPALSAWESVTTHHSDATKKTILRSDEQRWTSARWKMPAVEVELITQNYTVCIFRGSPFPSTAQAWKEWAQRGVTWASQRSRAFGPCQGLVAGLRARLIRGCQDGGMSGLRKQVQNIQNIASQTRPLWTVIMPCFLQFST